ncbi:uncharacterized protein MYCGRDRAFT_93101 [Zymoseptoria tritici IPO323]|uniref:RBR-type E3 ubiquitin transferase n=1 Tax=Zymoseptoria tritici (strain CBS 115943 / IPO323) TaxID=336722 RepID=F9XBC3_ZYMTI|nr:uncharacterized protein MYCGRDRAFT_93101 [Zymoseptoria tritici IPO323]EGP87095.1 hypothetical protein MYCGRDRAFT_93101 [Zymoseptoria tritici IPO323]
MPKEAKSSSKQHRSDPLARPEVPTFTCISCLENFTAQPVMVMQDSMCEKCFTDNMVPQFHLALANEINAPVRYGGVELSIDPYVQYFSEDFLLSWREKAVERQVLEPNRLYCAGAVVNDGEQCNKFLGDKNLHQSALPCARCGSLTCGECRDKIISDPHTCSDPDPDVAPAIPGLKLGVDYQRCPNCRKPIELREGCNHMSCDCLAHFCFLCGQLGLPSNLDIVQPAHLAQEGDQTWGRVSHWGGNSCPLYGPRNQEGQPIFDRPPPEEPDDLDSLWLFTRMLDMMYDRLETLPEIQAAPDPDAAVEAMLDLVLPNLHEAILQTLPALVMLDHMTAMDAVVREFGVHLYACVRNGTDPLDWMQAVADVANLLLNCDSVYVRSLINVQGLRIGEEHWAPLLPEVLRALEGMVHRIGPRGFALFPFLQTVVAGFRLAAQGDYLGLVALPDLGDRANLQPQRDALDEEDRLQLMDPGGDRYPGPGAP